MGVFDFISNKIGQAAETAAEARDKAEEMEEWEIIRKLKHINGIAEASGYIAVLRERCESLDDTELIELMESASNDKNAKAVQAMASVMEARNLIYRDDNGKIHRKYSY